MVSRFSHLSGRNSRERFHCALASGRGRPGHTVSQAQLSSAQLSSAQLSSAQLSSAQLSYLWLACLPVLSAVRDPRLQFVPLRAVMLFALLRRWDRVGFTTNRTPSPRIVSKPCHRVLAKCAPQPQTLTLVWCSGRSFPVIGDAGSFAIHPSSGLCYADGELSLSSQQQPGCCWVLLTPPTPQGPLRFSASFCCFLF
jgi:hypothetical protein